MWPGGLICGNLITVFDLTPPRPQCDAYTELGLGWNHRGHRLQSGVRLNTNTATRGIQTKESCITLQCCGTAGRYWSIQLRCKMPSCAALVKQFLKASNVGNLLWNNELCQNNTKTKKTETCNIFSLNLFGQNHCDTSR